MKIALEYFIIIVFANTVGAISGMGGGVIIKPLLDFMGKSPLSAINFYSSLAVFVMALVSTRRQVKNGVRLNARFAGLLSLGSVLGGFLGDLSFRVLSGWLPIERVNVVQIVLTLVSLVLALIYTRPGHFSWPDRWLPGIYIFSGALLGWLATLMGIGGGPINVAFLIYFFDIAIKDATVYSIVIILFSQITKLGFSLPHFGQDHISWIILPVVVLAAIFGGTFGAQLSKRVADRAVLLIYRVVVSAVLVLNVVNMVQLLR